MLVKANNLVVTTEIKRKHVKEISKGAVIQKAFFTVHLASLKS
jgi:hypothetical protein